MPDNLSADNLRENLTNPARNYIWDLIIASPVGGGDAETLEIRCQSTVVPGRSFGGILVPFKNTPGVKYPGKPTVPHTWQCTFIESVDGQFHNIINTWMDFIGNMRTGQGAAADTSIKRNIALRLISPDNQIITRIKLVGCYPEDLADAPLSYDDEDRLLYTLTWSYDRWQEV